MTDWPLLESVTPEEYNDWFPDHNKTFHDWMRSKRCPGCGFNLVKTGENKYRCKNCWPKNMTLLIETED